MRYRSNGLIDMSPTATTMTSLWSLLSSSLAIVHLSSLVSATFLLVVSNISGNGVDAVSFIGNEAKWRDKEDNVKKAMLILDPTQRAVDDGYVVGWHVYTNRGRRSQEVYLQIWRQLRTTENRYMLVGETLIKALWADYSYFALYPHDRIAIQSGDVLGLYFPKYNPIPWSGVKCDHGNEHLYKYNPYTVTSLHASPVQANGQKANVEVTFVTARNDWDPCRQYSVNATVMNSQEMAQYDYDYQETTDGRYERRPYGKYFPKRRSTASSFRMRSSVTSLLSDIRTWNLPRQLVVVYVSSSSNCLIAITTLVSLAAIIRT